MDDSPIPAAITWKGASIVGAIVLAVASALSVYFLEARSVRLQIAELRAEARERDEKLYIRVEQQREIDARLVFERIQKTQGDLYAAVEVGRVRWEHNQEMIGLIKQAVLALEQTACKAEAQSEAKDN